MCFSTFYCLLCIIWRQMWVVAESLQLNSCSSLVNLVCPCESQLECCIVPSGSLDRAIVQGHSENRPLCYTTFLFNGLFVELGLAGHSHSYAQCFGEYSSTGTHAKGITKYFPLNYQRSPKWWNLLSGPAWMPQWRLGWDISKDLRTCCGTRSVWQVQVTKEMLAAAFLSTLLLHRG